MAFRRSPDPYSLSRLALPAFALRATAGRLPPRSAPVAHPLRSFAPCNGRTLTTALDGFATCAARGPDHKCSGRAYSYRISIRRAHRLPPEGHGPPTATT
jgi:hypothetical protein